MAFAWSTVVRQVVSGVIMVAGVSRVYRPGMRRRGTAGPTSLWSATRVGQLVEPGSPQRGLRLCWAFDEHRSGRALHAGVQHRGVAHRYPRVDTEWRRDSGVFPGRHDEIARSSALRRGTGTVSLFACPIGALTLALAEPLILTVYGEKWLAAAPILSVLAVYGVLTVFGLLFANVVISVGRAGVPLGVQCIGTCCPRTGDGDCDDDSVGVGYAHHDCACHHNSGLSVRAFAGGRSAPEQVDAARDRAQAAAATLHWRELHGQRVRTSTELSVVQLILGGVPLVASSTQR